MLFQLLLEKGVRNFVCDTKIQAIQEELKECFREEGMTRYQQKKKIEENIRENNEKRRTYTFACENIRIVLISSQTRMGVEIRMSKLSNTRTKREFQFYYL
ncbi:MAG: hypothetical protein KH355_11605 [Clostridiales bacterium]|nr:hypothetical protein [Clostridiales bacterium]